MPRILERLSRMLSGSEVVHVEAIEHLVHHFDESNSFRDIWVSREGESLGH